MLFRQFKIYHIKWNEIKCTTCCSRTIVSVLFWWFLHLAICALCMADILCAFNRIQLIFFSLVPFVHLFMSRRVLPACMAVSHFTFKKHFMIQMLEDSSYSSEWILSRIDRVLWINFSPAWRKEHVEHHQYYLRLTANGAKKEEHFTLNGNTVWLDKCYEDDWAKFKNL